MENFIMEVTYDVKHFLTENVNENHDYGWKDKGWSEVVIMHLPVHESIKPEHILNDGTIRELKCEEMRSYHKEDTRYTEVIKGYYNREHVICLIKKFRLTKAIIKSIEPDNIIDKIQQIQPPKD